jgi:hypothetical protein
VRELVSRAIARRSDLTDVGLEDYQAHARGHIYFLFDTGRGTARHLIKADQLALDLYWRAPGRTRQVIVGRREERVLPTRIEYHIDHLTVVMDNFDDRIRMGEGSEVRDVLHPAAAGALDFYDYRLSDSLTLVMPDQRVRVYRVDVRPRDAGSPGLVGAVYLDRGTADIVRMEFTFTAAAYLDPQLDYINVRLENGLWDGRFWLPHRQGLELRREVRALNFPAGGIIRAEFEIGRYRFDTGFPEDLVQGPSVTYVPARARARFEFEEGLYDALDPAVAVAPPSLGAIREEATRMVRDAYLRRATKLRPAVPGVSSVVRFRRGEGLYVGPGISHDFPDGSSVLLLAGRAFGGDRWEVEGSLGRPLGRGTELELSGHLDRSADATPWSASSGAVATLAALIDGEDYREPYWSTGGSLALSRGLGELRGRLEVGFEEWEAARLESDGIVDRSYRPVRELDVGEVGFVRAGLSRPPVGALETVGGWTWDVEVEGATVPGDFDYIRGMGRAERLWPSVGPVDVRTSAALGALVGGRPPAQRLFPLGGRGTVRGHSFHAFAGNLYGRAGIEVAREVWAPFLTVAAFADAGWVGVEGSGGRRALDVWNQVDPASGGSSGIVAGLGVGAGLLFDILRLELARGVGERGIWELVVRASPRFWGWL